jgi:FkbM family methyltransferase
MSNTFLYGRPLNWVIRNSLKPFAAILPEKFKIPINGVFTVKGNDIPPFKMVTNPTNAVTKYLFWGNVEGFEYHAVKVFMRLVRQSKVFFDIGANIGYYSLLAGKINPESEVFAFEPMPSAFDFLQQNIQLNEFKKIHAIRLAISNENGKAVFYSIKNKKFSEFPQLTGDGSLNGEHAKRSDKFEFEVNTESLDHFVSSRIPGKKIDLIKLDTEANEHRVLAGANTVLNDHRPIIQCEILKNQIESEMEAVLGKYDYAYYRATDNGLVKVLGFKNNSTPFMDYYLVPREKIQMYPDLFGT